LTSKANSVDVYTKTQVDTKLGDYALSSALNSYALLSSLSDYALTSSLRSYVTSSSLSSSLSSYALTSSIGTYFNNAVRSTTDSANNITFSGSGNTITLNYDNLLNKLGSFALSTDLSNYVTNSSLSSTLNSYATTTALGSKQNTLSGSNLLDVSFVGTGAITNTVFNYLSGVTSSIQTQINANKIR
jgi:hypothetical protein